MTKPIFCHIIGLLMLSFGIIILASTIHFQGSSIIYVQSSSAATTSSSN